MICIKTEGLRRCSITSDHHRFGGFPGIGPSNDLGDAKACNHVGAIIANLKSIRRKIEETDESTHTVTVDFFIDQGSSKTRNIKPENLVTIFIHPFAINHFVVRIQYTACTSRLQAHREMNMSVYQ